MTNHQSNTSTNNSSDNSFAEAIEQFRLSDEDLMAESTPNVNGTKDASWSDASSSSSSPQSTRPYTFVPLQMGGNGGTHIVSEESRRLIEQEVTLADLEKMTSLFYEKVFQDPTLDQFIRSRDDPHGSRFAKWIHQKLSGSTVWDHDRKTRNLEPVTYPNGFRHVVHDRSSAHAAAWFSPKRPVQDVGRRFRLDECRVWMRLHFWALRESGLLTKSPSFADYYVRFIGHFVRVYESNAPIFARDSMRWSSNPSNIEAYIQNGRRMSDVLGLRLEQAGRQIPAFEANDVVWPYNETDPSQ